jgi:hypothetical protein
VLFAVPAHIAHRAQRCALLTATAVAAAIASTASLQTTQARADPTHRRQARRSNVEQCSTSAALLVEAFNDVEHVSDAEFIALFADGSDDE